MTKEKCNNNVITEDDFFKTKKYPIKHLLSNDHNIDVKRGKFLLPKTLYSSIIRSFFLSYFKKFYFTPQDIYFPLSGYLRKAKGKNYAKTEHGFNIGRSLLWIWYQRPSLAFFAHVRLKKTTGGSGVISKLDNQYKETCDIEMLPGINYALKSITESNKLFKP